MRLLKDGRTIATLRPDVAAPDSSGGIPMLLKLSDQPGSYEVRATITQGNSSTERTLPYTLAGSPPFGTAIGPRKSETFTP